MSPKGTKRKQRLALPTPDLGGLAELFGVIFRFLDRPLRDVIEALRDGDYGRARFGVFLILLLACIIILFTSIVLNPKGASQPFNIGCLVIIFGLAVVLALVHPSAPGPDKNLSNRQDDRIRLINPKPLM